MRDLTFITSLAESILEKKYSIHRTFQEFYEKMLLLAADYNNVLEKTGFKVSVLLGGTENSTIRKSFSLFFIPARTEASWGDEYLTVDFLLEVKLCRVMRKSSTGFLFERPYEELTEEKLLRFVNDFIRERAEALS